MKKTKFFGMACGLSIVLAGCGGFVYTSIGGTVTGLGTSGTNSLTLQNERGFFKTLTADGTFAFDVASNASYSITAAAQPKYVNCTIAGGTGKMSGEGVNNSVAVTCVPNVQLKGTLSGLPDGGNLTLNTNTTDTVKNTLQDYVEIVSANGTFQLAGKYVAHGKPYVVTVSIPPAARYCTVSNGTGTADNTTPDAAANIGVSCVPAVPVGFTVKGLNAGSSLTLSNTFGSKVDQRLVSAIGIYYFNWSLLDGTAYSVKVDTQPTGQTCTIQNPTGTVSMSNPAATNIIVNCV
ncbi:hypothetical protein [Undibacterium rugosum]|uniref:hypothetical protein n=1 Tax=Undibacterium rugosum TaxID=2762291 RepID=UPI001B837EF1|nr:hypothetical protein [Undibacterium rugosum]MBR7778040.1 hypothetical protein [Undibacterium rugosum]